MFRLIFLFVVLGAGLFVGTQFSVKTKITGASDDRSCYISRNGRVIKVLSGKIDTIILACTHYPLIEKKIKKHLPENIKLISQGNIVAKSLNDYLQRHPEMSHRCSKQGSIKFLTTDSPETFNNAAKLIYNKKVEAEQVGL